MKEWNQIVKKKTWASGGIYADGYVFELHIAVGIISKFDQFGV